MLTRNHNLYWSFQNSLEIVENVCLFRVWGKLFGCWINSRHWKGAWYLSAKFSHIYLTQFWKFASDFHVIALPATNKTKKLHPSLCEWVLWLGKKREKLNWWKTSIRCFEGCFLPQHQVQSRYFPISTVAWI